ncbi:hypothetical protein [Roseomonas elaeocarpi]|uniref:Methylamine utilization protein MauE n=1 Tax=Roseomonas elaeocarpi TaxID=907779 RepID=A0ABV6JS67_9PROT
MTVADKAAEGPRKRRWTIRLGAIALVAVALALMHWADVTKAILYNAHCQPYATGYPVWRLSPMTVAEFLLPAIPILFLRPGKRLYVPLCLLLPLLPAAFSYVQEAQIPTDCFSGQRDGNEHYELMGMGAEFLYLLLSLSLWCSFLLDLLFRALPLPGATTPR